MAFAREGAAAARPRPRHSALAAVACGFVLLVGLVGLTLSRRLHSRQGNGAAPIGVGMGLAFEKVTRDAPAREHIPVVITVQKFGEPEREVSAGRLTCDHERVRWVREGGWDVFSLTALPSCRTESPRAWSS